MKYNSYSAATATLFRAETPEQTWSWITGMFNDTSSVGKNSKSFIPGGHWLEEVEGKSIGVSPGSIYKYSTLNAGPYYVRIRKVQPSSLLEYTEQLMPKRGSEMGSSDSGIYITQYSIESHPEGCVLRVDRVEYGNLGLVRKVMGAFDADFNRTSCVGRLAYMIIGGEFPSGSKFERDGLYIERDDSLRKRMKP